MESQRHLRDLQRAARARPALPADRCEGAQRVAAVVAGRRAARVPARPWRRRALRHLAGGSGRRAGARPDERAGRHASRDRVVAAGRPHRILRQRRRDGLRHPRRRRRNGREARAHGRHARRPPAALVARWHAARLLVAPRERPHERRALSGDRLRRRDHAARHASRTGWDTPRLHDEHARPRGDRARGARRRRGDEDRAPHREHPRRDGGRVAPGRSWRHLSPQRGIGGLTAPRVRRVARHARRRRSAWRAHVGDRGARLGSGGVHLHRRA